MEFEAAPFKMTASFERILQANDGLGMKRFKDCMVNGLFQLNKNAAKIILLV
jgi:hypothetical protein